MFNSPIYFLFECVINLFYICHNTWALNSQTFLFIRHVRSCRRFGFGFSAFQHFASWLSSLPEPHLMALRDSQLHANASSNPAAALVIISRSLIHSLTHFPLLFFACKSWWLIISVPPPDLSAALIWRWNTLPVDGWSECRCTLSAAVRNAACLLNPNNGRNINRKHGDYTPKKFASYAGLS